jgi:hypothetical protein
MDSFTLALAILALFSAMWLFFIMASSPREEEGTPPPAPQPPKAAGGACVDLTRREAAHPRRMHPVLTQNVAVARLLRLESLQGLQG